MVIVKQDWPKIDPILAIATGVRDNGRNTRDLLIDKENQQAQQAIDATKKRISQALETLEPLFDSADGKAAYVALKKNREAYVSAFTQLQVLIRQGAFDAAIAQLKQHVIPAEQQVYKSLDALMTLQGQIFADRERSAQALYNDARLNMLGLLVFCLASVIAAAVIVTRSVTRPLGGEPDDAARVFALFSGQNNPVDVLCKCLLEVACAWDSVVGAESLPAVKWRDFTLTALERVVEDGTAANGLAALRF